MKIGYARVSTVEQEAGFDAQLRDLAAIGCERIFSEKISGLTLDRPELNAALAYMRPGDELVCTKLDRLARDLEHLLHIGRKIEEAGCGLIIMGLGVDTTTPIGKFILHLLGAVAELEVSSMKMRQAEGIAAAKRAGKYKGSAGRSRRKSRPDGPLGKSQSAYVVDVLMHDDMRNALGKQRFTRNEIATIVGCAPRTVYRILEDAGRIKGRVPKQPPSPIMPQQRPETPDA